MVGMESKVSVGDAPLFEILGELAPLFEALKVLPPPFAALSTVKILFAVSSEEGSNHVLVR